MTATILYIVLAVVAFAIILAICIKYPQGKWFFGTICMAVLIAGTCYCGIQLNYYYTASGGIFGKLSGIFDTNVVEVENATFTFTNIELTETEGDVYSAVITTNEVLQLEKGIAYGVYVNNSPCSNIQNARDYVTAEYSYVFYDESFKPLCSDTLYFRFAFYNNSTLLNVRTQGGADAVKYWNYYFNKNTFVVKIGKADYVKDENLTFTNGAVPDYSVLKYTIDGKSTETIVAKGKTIGSLGIYTDKLCYNFKGWKLENSSIVGNEYVINSNCSITAVYEVKKLSDCSWEEINKASEKGIAKTVFSIGDEKDISLSTGEVLTVAIIDFGKDELTNGTGNAGITFGLVHLYSKKYQMFTTNTNYGGWQDSYIRNTVMKEIYSQLSEDLQKVIKEVNKYSGQGSKSNHVIPVPDKLWLFSAAEIFGAHSSEYTDDFDGPHYSYFPMGTGLYKEKILIKRMSNGSGEATSWWVRTPRESPKFEIVEAAGGRNFVNATQSLGICFGFCV